jgi:UDP-GlcNAc:undecaprenyl-phosphate GlcNAc-1-phosphate transferase
MLDLGNFSVSILIASYVAFTILASVLMNGLLLKFSLSLGMKNDSSQIRWATAAKPAFGGISFYILFLFAVVFYSIFFPNQELLLNKKFLGFFIAVSLGFIMGLADDAYNTKPFLKFLVQFLCGISFVLTDNIIQITPWYEFNLFITFFWVVGLMNSLNMLDNMDGITTSVSIIICIGALTSLAFRNEAVHLNTILMLGVVSTLFGFLYYNWNPSRMYMGDSGSQFLGVFLAGIGIEYFWNAPDYYGVAVQSKQFLIAVLMFVVPISDTTTVSINRILKGKSPFVGGRDHTTHHLSYMGLTDRHVALVMIGLSSLSMFLAIFVMNNVRNWNTTYTVSASIVFLLILGGLYSTTRISKPKAKS